MLHAASLHPPVDPCSGNLQIISTLEYAPAVPDGNACIVCDRATARYFRFGPKAVAVLRCLDGTHTVETISVECGLSVDATRALLERLQALHLVVESGSSAAVDSRTTLDVPPDAVRRPRVLRTIRVRRLSLLTIHIDLIRGDAWLRWLHDALRLRVLFTPVGGILLLGLWLLGGSTWVLYRARFATTALSLIGVRGLILTAGVTVVVGILHELAHGVACKHFGGTVRSMGIGLYYFSPVYYTDVSDAWMFPSRAQRLITHAAGIGMNLVLASLAALLFLWGSPTAWLAQLCFLVFFVGTINSAINLNPLLQLDGYFLLTDLIGVANVRTHAFAYVVTGIARILPQSRRFITFPIMQRRPPTSRERWLLVVYGGCALVYAVVLLRVIVMGVGQFLVQHFGPVGWFIALAGGVGILVGFMWMSLLASIIRRIPKRTSRIA